MKIIVHTPLGPVVGIEEVIPALDRANVRKHLEQTVSRLNDLSITTSKGFTVIPGALLARSILTVENFNNMEESLPSIESKE